MTNVIAWEDVQSSLGHMSLLHRSYVVCSIKCTHFKTKALPVTACEKNCTCIRKMIRFFAFDIYCVYLKDLLVSRLSIRVGECPLAQGLFLSVAHTLYIKQPIYTHSVCVPCMSGITSSDHPNQSFNMYDHKANTCAKQGNQRWQVPRPATRHMQRSLHLNVSSFIILFV